MDPIFTNILSDLFVNLSAGWFGAAIILPLNVKKSTFRLIPLVADVSFGIFAFFVAFIMRKL